MQENTIGGSIFWQQGATNDAPTEPTADLFRAELKHLLNQRHPWYQLTADIDGARFELIFGPL